MKKFLKNKLILTVLSFFIAPQIVFAQNVEANAPLMAVEMHNDVTSEGTAFTLHALRDVTLKEHMVDFTSSGKLEPGKTVQSRDMKMGETYKFRDMLPEGIPHRMFCVNEEKNRFCWIPALSGEDGSLILAPRFVQKK